MERGIKPASLVGDLRRTNQIVPRRRIATTFLAPALLAPALIATDSARADIGFAAAATACRAQVPGQALTALRQRTRNGVWVYEGDFANNPPTVFTTATIDRDTGAFIDLATAPMPPDERAATQQTLQRLLYAGTDFAAAVATATAESGRTDTERVALLYEAGVLAFRVNYFDDPVVVSIDSITGGSIPAIIPGLGIEPTVTVAEMAGAIAHAQFVAGIDWRAIEATAIQRFDGVTVRVLLAHRVSGFLMQPEIVQGFFVPSPVFAPVGAQVVRAATVSASSPVVCVAIPALASVQAASPGLGANRLRLERIDGGGTTGYRWIAGIVDAGETERDAWLDATVPAPKKSPAFTAPFDLTQGDVTRDGVVDARDLSEILSFWGAINPILDVDGSGSLGPGDLAVVLSEWPI